MVKRIASGLLWIFYNVIVNHIPSWIIRRFLYECGGMKIGKGARIGLMVRVSKVRNITIGERSVINQNCYLDGRGGLIIENDVTVSAFSFIITETHLPNSEKFDTKTEAVIIKDHAWLGMRAMVLNGSVVEKNVIIGAGCVFKGKSEPNDIIVGNPSRVVKKRELSNDYEKKYRAFFI